MFTQIDNNEVIDFVEYVDSFYNPKTGVFPIKGATLEVITKAIKAPIIRMIYFTRGNTFMMYSCI